MLLHWLVRTGYQLAHHFVVGELGMAFLVKCISESGICVLRFDVHKLSPADIDIRSIMNGLCFYSVCTCFKERRKNDMEGCNYAPSF